MLHRLRQYDPATTQCGSVAHVVVDDMEQREMQRLVSVHRQYDELHPLLVVMISHFGTHVLLLVAEELQWLLGQLVT